MDVTQIKQMLDHIIITITTTTEFQFQIPEQCKDLAQDMINDKTFFEKIKQYMVEESLKDTSVTKDEMIAIYDEVMSKYSVEKCLRLFGYFFCGTYVKDDYPTLIQMSDGFVFAFYKFYKEDPTSEFVFGVKKFIYSPEVINCGLLVSIEFMQGEVTGIGNMINESMSAIVNHNNYPYVGNEFDWVATIIASDEIYKTADHVVYFVFTMGRTTMFDREDKMNLFLEMMDVLWGTHCFALAECSSSDIEKIQSSEVH